MSAAALIGVIVGLWLHFRGSRPPSSVATAGGGTPTMTLTSWLFIPRSKLRGWLVGIGAAGLALALDAVFLRAHPALQIVPFLTAFWIGCGAYEHPSPLTGMLNNARMPNSRPRGWSVGVGVFGLLAIFGGERLDALVKAHEWFSLALIPIPWWIGYRTYEQPNPLPAMWRDLRRLFPPSVIVWAVVGVLAFFFADPIKSTLESILPTTVPGLAAMLFGMLLGGGYFAWYIESEARKLREELTDIKRALEELNLKIRADDAQGGSRLPL